MKKFQKVLLAVLLLVFSSYILHYMSFICYVLTCYSKDDFPSDFKNANLMKSPGIMFVETTDTVEPSALAVCSVESASLRNPGKPIHYFLKGFSGNLSHYPRPWHKAIHVLSSLKNVTISPLSLKALFQDTPLSSWYEKAEDEHEEKESIIQPAPGNLELKISMQDQNLLALVNPYWEKYWIHVLSDACRIALLWKYGGIYLDTDIISLRPLEFRNFICAEGYEVANGAALGFEKHHQFIWDCMEDYVSNYDGGTWGSQGPALVSRVLKRWCQSNELGQFFNLECKGISYLPPKYFYPISYTRWETYFQRWQESNIKSFFAESKGVHVWNYKNFGQQKQVTAGSGTLMEYFFSKYCPTTYKSLVKSASQG